MIRVFHYLVIAFSLLSADLYSATYYTTTAGSTWEAAAVWGTTTDGAGELWSTITLSSGDTIYIDDDLNLDTDLTISVDVIIILDATLTIYNKLRLTWDSKIIFTSNGRLVPGGNGASQKISFGGNELWHGGMGEEVGPGTMDNTYNGALPINLVFFTATALNNEVLLTWKTASETNNDYFTVERSMDGMQYQYVATVNGSGTSTSPVVYTYSDLTPHFGRSYYRLSQTDLDGTTVVAQVVSVAYSTVKGLTVYPNPVKGGTILNVQTGANADEKVYLMIYNYSGRLIRNEQLSSSSIKIADDFEAGSYLLKVRSGDTSRSTRLMVE